MPEDYTSSFKFDDALASLFDHAGKLFGLEFRRESNTTAEGRTFSVLDKTSHEKIGTLYVDPYDTQSMTTFQDESTEPAAVVHMNITRPSSGTETSLSIQDVGTLFHLSAHAIQHLVSQNALTKSSTAVNADFVEMPSSLQENFLRGDFERFITSQPDETTAGQLRKVLNTGSGTDPSAAFRKFMDSKPQ